MTKHYFYVLTCLFIIVSIIYPRLRTFFHCFQREGKGTRKTSVQKRNVHWLPAVHPQTGDWRPDQGLCVSGPGLTHPQTRGGPHNLGVCSDWASPFGYPTMLQPPELHWPGPSSIFSKPSFLTPRVVACTLLMGGQGVRAWWALPREALGSQLLSPISKKKLSFRKMDV